MSSTSSSFERGRLLCFAFEPHRQEGISATLRHCPESDRVGPQPSARRMECSLPMERFTAYPKTRITAASRSHFILAAESEPSRDAMGDAYGTLRVVLVRCSVTTMECERAGDEFTRPYSYELDLK
jgi:hypothetical protein